MSGAIMQTALDEIISLHSEIISSARMTLDKAIRIGELLTEQKAKLKHGKWLPWINECLPFSDETARNYMRVFARRDEIPNILEFGVSDAYRLLTQSEEDGPPETEPLPGFLSPPPEPVPQAAPEPQIQAQPEPTQMAECPDCGSTFDPLRWDADLSGYKCPYCWRDNTAKPKAETEKAPTKDVPHVFHNSGENEWYTPPQFTAAAREVMGEIDTDPASCETANKFVKAETFFSIDNSGLEKEWRGRVWMNPPYAQPLIAQFSSKLLEEIAAKRTKEACVLVNNATDTGWLQDMMESAAAICFPRGRIKFIDRDGNPSGAPLQGQAILYFGKATKKFGATFSKFGRVLYA